MVPAAPRAWGSTVHGDADELFGGKGMTTNGVADEAILKPQMATTGFRRLAGDIGFMTAVASAAKRLGVGIGNILGVANQLGLAEPFVGAWRRRWRYRNREWGVNGPIAAAAVAAAAVGVERYGRAPDVPRIQNGQRAIRHERPTYESAYTYRYGESYGIVHDEL